MLLIMSGQVSSPGTMLWRRSHGKTGRSRCHTASRRHGDPDVQIPVAADLTTVPGIPLRETDLSFYSRTYPQETQNTEKAADRQRVATAYSPEMREYRKDH